MLEFDHLCLAVNALFIVIPDYDGHSSALDYNQSVFDYLF